MRRLLTVVAVLLPLVVSAQTDPRTLPRVTAADVTYLGAFTLPASDGAGRSLTWGGTALGLSADGKALYYACNGAGSFARVSIPAIGQVASVLDACKGPSNLLAVDPTTPNGVGVGGVLDTGAGLVVTGYSYYDGNEDAAASHWAGASLSALTGPVRVAPSPGWVGGAMGTIPPEWQALAGGKFWTALHSISIINRSSFGETLTVFDQADLTGPTRTLLGYPPAHPLAPYSTANPLWNGATRASGMAWVPGTRSVLSFRQHGDAYCYGMAGTTCPADALKPGSQGEHGGPPYRHRILAWDAGDLVNVKPGGAEMWQPQPYDNWIVRDIADDGLARPVASVFDAATLRWYVVEQTLDSTPASEQNTPTVHVFQVKVGTPAPTPTPCAGTWGAWTRQANSESACSASGTRTFIESRLFTVSTSGPGCPASPESRTSTDACNPPVVMETLTCWVTSVGTTYADGDARRTVRCDTNGPTASLPNGTTFTVTVPKK